MVVSLGITIHDPRSTIHDPRSTIHDPRSTIHDPRSTIHDPRSTIHDPRSTIIDRVISCIHRASRISKYRIRISKLSKPLVIEIWIYTIQTDPRVTKESLLWHATGTKDLALIVGYNTYTLGWSYVPSVNNSACFTLQNATQIFLLKHFYFETFVECSWSASHS